MARKVVLSGGFLSPYIASDDGAIGPNADYDKYTETGNRKHLDLIPGEKPDVFWIKRLSSREMISLSEFMDVISDEKRDDQSRADAVFDFNEAVLRTCLRGVERYEYAVERDDDGEMTTAEFSIKRGDDPTDEQVRIISDADPSLASQIFKFAVAISSLSTEQKKT